MHFLAALTLASVALAAPQPQAGGACTAGKFQCSADGSGWQTCDVTGTWQPGGSCDASTQACTINEVNQVPYCAAKGGAGAGFPSAGPSSGAAFTTASQTAAVATASSSAAVPTASSDPETDPTMAGGGFIQLPSSAAASSFAVSSGAIFSGVMSSGIASSAAATPTTMVEKFKERRFLPHKDNRARGLY
ncbi:Uu.00g117800.m01.CDS01 [Anthostomella pinea]|uniref:Uu.00g117800.m01.CDS01 n=1 Tax=Anthostomella pinea TaxID=933095 RepID=A0AAI8VGT7_9PEZI|nr:Uu.00g117800.m01.CDS01 [Anthostomella pinea]